MTGGRDCDLGCRFGELETRGFPLETVCFFCVLGGKDIEGLGGNRRNQMTVFPELVG